MSPLDRRRFLHASAIAATALGAGRLFAAAAARKYKLGLVTYNVAKDWDLPTILRIAPMVGIAAVELRTTHKHGVEPTLSAAARKDVKQKFADAGVVVWGCGSVCEFHSPDPAVVRKNVETCKQFAQLTADLGGKGVKVRPNGLAKGVEPAKTLAQIGKALIECGKSAADVGVEIWVEVHGAETQKPANMKTIMEECGHKNVGITWNSNGTDVVKGSVAESFALLKPWLRSCHINDLENDAAGRYPYRELFKLLREADYDRYTLIEVGKTPPDVDSGIEFLKRYHKMWDEMSRG